MSQMLHINPQDFLVPEKKSFKGVFTIYGPDGHLGHVTQVQQTQLSLLYQLGLHVEFGFDWPSGLWGEDVWRFSLYESV